MTTALRFKSSRGLLRRLFCCVSGQARMHAHTSDKRPTHTRPLCNYERRHNVAATATPLNRRWGCEQEQSITTVAATAAAKVSAFSPFCSHGCPPSVRTCPSSCLPVGLAVHPTVSPQNDSDVWQHALSALIFVRKVDAIDEEGSLVFENTN